MADIQTNCRENAENLILKRQNNRLQCEIYDLQQRITKLSKILNAYGLNEDSETDFRQRFGENGDFVLITAFIRLEFQDKYELSIPQDVKAMVCNIYNKLWSEDVNHIMSDLDDDQLSLDEFGFSAEGHEHEQSAPIDCYHSDPNPKELFLDFSSSNTNDQSAIAVYDDPPSKRTESSPPVIDLGFEDPDVLLHYERLKNKDLEQELKKYIVDKKQLDVLFGATITELIPFGLNESFLRRYRALFDGYYRQLYKETNDMIAHDINHLISCYYPVFGCNTFSIYATDHIMD